MRESWRNMVGGLFAIGKVATGSGEALAAPEPAQHEAHETQESNTAWVHEAKEHFDLARAHEDVDAMTDAVQDFVREFRAPTRGAIRQSAQRNPMRVMTAPEWQEVYDTALYFCANAADWGVGHAYLEHELRDVLTLTQGRIVHPIKLPHHEAPSALQQRIDRSLGYK